MPKRTESSRARASFAAVAGHRSILHMVLLLLVVGAVAAAAQVPDEVDELLRSLEESYEALPLRGGYALRPRQADQGFQAIEVSSEGIAVDGELTDRQALEERVGEDAETILRLAAAVGDPVATAEVEAVVEERVRQQVEEAEREREEERSESRARRERRGVVRTDTRVSFGSSLKIEEDESSRDVVVLVGSLDVRGEVRGDAVVVFGSVEVSGHVSGSVTAVGGSVSLGPNAQIDGDVVSVGGFVHRQSDARISGEVIEVSLGPLVDSSWEDFDWPKWGFGGFGFAWGEVFTLIGNTLVLGIVVLLVFWIGRQRIERVAERAVFEPWKAGMVGLVAQVLFLPVLFVAFLILLVSVVGIPLALLLVPLSFLALFLALLIGYTAIAWCSGRWLQDRFGLRWAPGFLILLGVLMIQGWSIVGESLSFVGGPIKLTALLMIALGFLVKYVAWTTGLGAVLMHELGAPMTTSIDDGALPFSSTPPPPPAAWPDFDSEAAWGDPPSEPRPADEASDDSPSLANVEAATRAPAAAGESTDDEEPEAASDQPADESDEPRRGS